MISPLSVEHELVKVPFVTFEETGRVGYCSFHTLLPANHYLAIVAATEPHYYCCTLCIQTSHWPSHVLGLSYNLNVPANSLCRCTFDSNLEPSLLESSISSNYRKGHG